MCFSRIGMGMYSMRESAQREWYISLPQRRKYVLQMLSWKFWRKLPEKMPFSVMSKLHVLLTISVRNSGRPSLGSSAATSFSDVSGKTGSWVSSVVSGQRPFSCCCSRCTRPSKLFTVFFTSTIRVRIFLKRAAKRQCGAMISASKRLVRDANECNLRFKDILWIYVARYHM